MGTFLNSIIFYIGIGGSVLMESDRNGSVSIDMDSLSRDQHSQMQLVEQQVTTQARTFTVHNIARVAKKRRVSNY